MFVPFIEVEQPSAPDPGKLFQPITDRSSTGQSTSMEKIFSDIVVWMDVVYQARIEAICCEIELVNSMKGMSLEEPMSDFYRAKWDGFKVIYQELITNHDFNLKFKLDKSPPLSLIRRVAVIPQALIAQRPVIIQHFSNKGAPLVDMGTIARNPDADKLFQPAVDGSTQENAFVELTKRLDLVWHARAMAISAEIEFFRSGLDLPLQWTKDQQPICRRYQTMRRELGITYDFALKTQTLNDSPPFSLLRRVNAIPRRYIARRPTIIEHFRSSGICLFSEING